MIADTADDTADDIDDLAVRADRARQVADVSPGVPSGSFQVTSRWRPLPGQSDGDVSSQSFDDLARAQLAGRRLSCCAGLVSVTVYGPDGTVHATFDRANSFWLVHTDEAREPAVPPG
jgi:hypothetical protein